MIYAPGMYGIAAPDGNYAAMGTCLALHDASWLISPEITPAQGEQLMFELYFDVRALYVWTPDNVDENDGLILNRINAENMKICVSVEGGEWIVLKDLWDEYGKLGYHEIIDEYPAPEFRKFVLPLDEYAGKKVKIGFCHSFLNNESGHGMFLDAVKVSLPPVEASYELPFGTLFWGMSNDLMAMPSWAIMPYYTEQEWFNTTQSYGPSSWEYMSLSTEDTFTSSERDLITTYNPDYSSDPEATYTMYSFPTLSVTDEAGTTGTYTYAGGDGIVFAGIAAELPSREGPAVQFGMSTFDQGDDVQIYNADFSTPAWGYSPMTADWWTNHYFNGEVGEGDLAEVVANINFFYTNGAPLVIDGVRVAASVECEDDAEFRMDIIPLDEDFVPGDPIATSTVKGSDLIRIDDSYAYFPNTAMICFKFDTPVVVDGFNFIARISGFNSEKVTYYAPLQSYKSVELCYGFSAVKVVSPSTGQEGETMVPTAVFEDLNNSFAMYLDARMPYLVCEDTEFEASADNNVKEFVFDSSYPAEELNVADATGSIPEWLSVEKSGRFGDTKVKVTVLEGADTPATAELTVSAPGVSRTITVKQGAWSGVSQIAGGNAVVTERQWFDISGRRLASEPAAGIYIVKDIRADGSVNVDKIVK